MESTQVIAHQVFLKARRISNIVNSVRFRTAWAAAPEKSRKEITQWVSESDEHNVMLWFNKYAPLYGFKQIMDLAQKHHVRNYSRMTKNELLNVLIQNGIIKESEL